jgi:uncharacterized protein YprB with RNaseH-like and TPR domain
MGLERILFLDIETVPEYRNYIELPESRKYFWKRRARIILGKDMEDLSEEELHSSYFERSGIYAEFAKVVCISVGYFNMEGDQAVEFRKKSFASVDEKEVLEPFCHLLDSHFSNPSVHSICGHNIKEFDVPFICRRLLIHAMGFPNLLKIRGKKPWELNHFIDTMELWKFGDRKNYTSLDLLAHIFDIPSSKDDIDGSLVGRVFWEDQDLDRIVTYCEKDVVTTARVWAALNNIQLNVF